MQLDKQQRKKTLDIIKEAESDNESEFGLDDTHELLFQIDFDDDYFYSQDDATDNSWEYENQRDDANVITCDYLLDKLRHRPTNFRTSKLKMDDPNRTIIHANVMKCEDLTEEQAKYLLRPTLHAQAQIFLSDADDIFEKRLADDLPALKDSLQEEFEDDDVRQFNFYVEKGFEYGLLCPERENLALQCENPSSEAKRAKCEILDKELFNKCRVPIQSKEEIIL